ncbi:type I-E CRISPR-associated protein Cas5/CasD [Shimia sp. SDUM112013]|uniref:type I-E CRISPR-associated protein Cas5/CasD n=1 Tax=Shimia sp. SDUM112013 TaxID=3136160 RepID=UPI0032EDD088
MSHRWLHMHLAAPLMSFGGVAIDHVGPTRDFPAASALTGLLANALGWRWQDRAAHVDLQARLVFGAGIARQGRVVTDTQNAKLEKADKGWTTWGAPEGRAGATYDAPHRRQRDYLADHACHVVLRVAEGDGPDLDTLADALQRPVRPLFLGRKPCLPSVPIFAGWATGDTARAALTSLEVDWSDGGEALWPETDDLPEGARIVDLADLRNWDSGLHGGARPVVRGRLG